MIEERDLDAAVTAGILDPAARERLQQFSRDHRRGAAGPDEEQFRLLTGFNDIFVTIAVVLVMIAVGSLAGRLAPALGAAGVAAAAWGLAEYFTRQRRMALPSIVLLLAFVGAVFSAVMTAMSGAPVFGPGSGGGWPLLAAGAAAVAAAWLHWRRFMVPITVAAGAAAASLLIVLLGGAALGYGLGIAGDRSPVLLPLVAACGVAVFALAMWFDSRDLARVTRRTDVAFWLHLLAAPMLVHPIFTLTGLTGGAPTPGAALIVVIVYAALTVVALAIDRRALLVSALGYVIYAIQALLSGGGTLTASFGLTALLIGLFLVLLSAAWRPIRNRVVRWLPAGVARRLPQPAG